MILCYQLAVKLQHKTNSILLNPMLVAMSLIIAFISYIEMPIADFKLYSAPLNALLEPAIVVLGLPLFQQLQAIKKNIVPILAILCIAIFITLTISFILSIVIINELNISISIALKSITTPIGLALTDKLGGLSSLTALTITIAGLTGGIFGHKWLMLLKITTPQAQGFAIGCASHALGTSSISRVSYQHSAFASLALVLSAIITALMAPLLLPLISDLIFPR